MRKPKRRCESTKKGEKMKIQCGKCGGTLPLPVDESFFEDGNASKAWKQHGHFPSLAIYVCPCGATHETGPDVHTDAAIAAAQDFKWILEHKAHAVVN